MPELWKIFRRKDDRVAGTEGLEGNARSAKVGKVRQVLAFLSFLVTEPITELNHFLSAAKDSFTNLARPKTIIYIIALILLVEVVVSKNRMVAFGIVVCLILAFLYKEWVGGHWKKYIS